MFVTKNKGRSQKKMMKGDRDESRSNSRSRYKNVERHYCHRTGHIQRNCFLWKKESKDKKGKQKEKDRDDDRVTTATSDLLHLVSDESM